MKIITGEILTIPARSYLYDEEIRQIIGTTKNYFSSWHSHDRLGRPGESYVLENAIYTYPGGNIDIRVRNTIYLNTNKEIRKIFYDISGLNKTHDDSIQYDVIEIQVNNRLAGYYLTDINTLLLSDWTHGDSEVIVFKDIWEQLVSKLNLRPIGNTERIRPISKITVGCDPEFELLKDGEVINAEEEIDSDSMYSQIGLDGAGDQVEIRPKPGSPIEVTQEIRKLVRKFYENYKGFSLGSTGDEYPLGGHIHVGIGFEYWVPEGLIELLDDFVGRPTIKLSGNARGSYNKLGQVRRQPHGFEYRSTPANVFQNPAIACIVMKLVKNLTKKYLSGEVLSYNDNPTKEDYIRIGGITSSQARYFMKFCSNKQLSNDISKDWKLKVIKESCMNPIVEIRDYWDSNVARHLKQEIGKIRVNRPIKVVLYGLSKERFGNNACTLPACTLPLRGLTKIVESKPLWNSDKTIFQVGVTFDRRHLDSSLGTPFGDLFGKALVQEIEKYIQEE